MKLRLIAASLGLVLIGMTVMIRAGEQPKQAAPAAGTPAAGTPAAGTPAAGTPGGGTPGTGAQVKDDLASKEQQLARQFADFQSQLLRLKQRLDKGTPDEQKRAVALGKLIEQIQKDSLTIQFEQLADLLRESRLSNVPELKQMAERSANLSERLRDYLRMLSEDPRQNQLRAEREFLQQMLKNVEKLIQKEKQVQGLTESGKTDHKELQQNQNQVAKKTGDLEKAIDKFLGNGSGEPKEAKDLKGGPKDAGKGTTAKAKAKGEGDEPTDVASNQGEPKDGGEKPGQPGDKGSPKGDAKGDPSKGDKGSESAQAGQKKDGKGSDSAQAGQKKDDKGSDAAQGSQAKSDGAKGSKAAEASKSAHGEAKAGSDSKGQSQAKSDGAQSPQSPPPQATAKDDPGAKGSPGSPGSLGSPGSPGSPGAPSPGSQKTKDELANNKKKVQEAGYEMKKAEDNLAANKKKPAVIDEGKAIDKLQEVKENLEKLLRQTREEELERLLAALEARCRKMLEMQLQVLAGTEQTHKAILAHVDQKAARADQQNALKLSDNERDIVVEANKAIQMLEEEGSAVAFPEVFQQVREDMKHVQRRLEVADVADVTQAVEKDIIASLQEMIDALKKARQELDKSKSSPPGQPPPNADQKLLDQIAELKMIRSLQKRINDRTRFYGRLFPGEQALDGNLQQQLQQLSERQERIFEIMDRFAKGDSK